MNTDRRRAVAALAAAGLAWGTTVPLSKLALGWLAPGWLTVVRFGIAAAVLLPAASRRGLRAAWTPRVLAAGALGYGGSVVLQNAGITRTSVTHAALLIGAAPVRVAIIAAVWHRTVARPVAWAGFAVSLAGAGLITGGRGGGATTGGDALVLASLVLSASVTVAQGRLLRNRDPMAVTAVQFLGAALSVLPFAVATEGLPAAPTGPGAVLAVAGLAAGGTLLPFTLFAYGQSRVSAEVAGAFLNLEPLVGAAAGTVFFANPAGLAQVIGGAAIIAGIALGSLPLLGGDRRRPGEGRRAEEGRLTEDGRRPEDRRRPEAQASRRPRSLHHPWPGRPNARTKNHQSRLGPRRHAPPAGRRNGGHARVPDRAPASGRKTQGGARCRYQDQDLAATAAGSCSHRRHLTRLARGGADAHRHPAPPTSRDQAERVVPGLLYGLTMPCHNDKLLS